MFAILQLLNTNRRLLKTVLAAGISWFLADELIGSPHPYFAPMAAVVVLQVTVAESLWHSVERIVGVIIGVLLALAATRLVEINALTLSLLVMAALAAGAMLGFSQSAVHQLAISAILVANLGPTTHGYAWAQVEETILGAAVAVAINAAIIPYNHLLTVRHAFGKVGRDMSRLLADLAAELRASDKSGVDPSLNERSEAIFADLRGLRDALGLARQSLQWNYFGYRRRAEFARYQGTCEALDDVAVVLRGMTRTLCEADSQDSAMAPLEVVRRARQTTAGALSELLSACAQALYHLTEHAASGGPSFEQQLAERLANAQRRRRALLEGLKTDATILSSGQWVWMGAVTTDLGRIFAEMVAQAAVCASP